MLCNPSTLFLLPNVLHYNYGVFVKNIRHMHMSANDVDT